MAAISFRDVSKVYQDGTPAVSSFSLDVASGDFVVFVGPSGCGKTTLLRMVAGLEDISTGEVAIGERVVNAIPPKDRDIAMVFQSYALYPHMTVFENMAFGLKLRKMPRDQMKQRVDRAAEMLGLSELLDRKPRALSGGQRQRVAMGRAIVREPAAFLMDEPLSNLDAKLRVQMRAEIASLQRELGVTTIYVTHDQTEAMTMADRVAVIRHGKLQDVAPPQQLYDDPVNLFVAGFIGSPAMNMLMAKTRPADGTVALELGTSTIRLPQGPLAAALGARGTSDVVVGIRPEDLEVASGDNDGARLPGIVRLREPLGAEIIVHIEVDVPPAVTDEVRELAADVGAGDELSDTTTKAVLVARLDPHTNVRAGDRIDVTFDPRALHAFDPVTGTSIGRGGNR